MPKPVLFVSGLGQPLNRTENLKALYNAYDGPKLFMSVHNKNYKPEVASGKYDLMVIDVFPTVSPGKTIMCWHAIMGGKYVGLDERATYYKPEYADLITAIISTGTDASRFLHQCTGVPMDRILPLGMPRTDAYFYKKKGDGHTVLSGKKAYFYVPTYRTKQETPMPEIDWKWLNDQLHDDELLVVKSHPFTRSLNIRNYKHIMEISGVEPSTNYLYDSDVVITDYSSIIFDAYLLNKPVVLFEKNPGYTDASVRGMYMHYPDEYCSRYATTEESLLAAVRAADKLTPLEENLIYRLAGSCYGLSCEKIVDLIHKENGVD